MFLFAIFLGVYTYVLFFLGIAGILYKNVIVVASLLSVISFLIIKKKAVLSFFTNIKLIAKRKNKIANPQLFSLFTTLVIIQVLVNYIGALVPELAFDALWYHLTLPKLYILNHSIYHIPGGLLYYSDMPKLGELLYIGALSFGDEITAKLVHLFFGLLISIAIYLFSRKFYSHTVALLAVVIFYSNLVVAWESTTAYVDLIRAFFEIMALWAFTNWRETENRKWLLLSAIMVGLAITTKFLAFGSLIIFLSLVLLPSKKTYKNKIVNSFIYILVAIAVPLPWLIFAYLNTGNPFYPFFSDIYKIAPEPFSLTRFFVDIWNVFVSAPDPISPIYIIFLPLVIIVFSKMRKEIKLIILYSALSIVIWYFTPRTGGGRFLLPYLPAFSIVCAAVFDYFLKQKNRVLFTRYMLGLVICTSVITIGYRFLAQAKYTPVLIGSQTKHDFLKDNLNFSYGDFYDIDGYIKLHINPSEKVLLYGFHNLYYVDFPFIDSSWVKPGDTFTYIAVQNGEIPERFKDWQLIYSNDKTAVKLYRNKSAKINIY